MNSNIIQLQSYFDDFDLCNKNDIAIRDFILIFLNINFLYLIFIIIRSVKIKIFNIKIYMKRNVATNKYWVTIIFLAMSEMMYSK